MMLRCGSSETMAKMRCIQRKMRYIQRVNPAQKRDVCVSGCKAGGAEPSKFFDT